MPSALVLASDASDPSDCDEVVADLERAGVVPLAVVGCADLLREVLRRSPDVVVAWQPQPDPALYAAVAQMQGTAPRPLLAFTNEVQIEAFERALQAGVSAWVVQGYAPQRLRPLLQQAQLRFRQEQAAREALVDLNRRYEERTLVDRAKGVLMRARALDEEDAFRLLRHTSMKAKLRIGQVAQQVVDVSRDAQAVNRAGQLRMLSQRLVKWQALRVAGVDVALAERMLQQSLQRADDQLATLQRSLSAPTFGDLVDAAQGGFASLKLALAQPPSAAGLLAVDDAAERWLQQADRLTEALQSASSAVPLHVVNLAGRQRMLSQRIAKLALLAANVPTVGTEEDLRASMQALEAALVQLRGLPLSSPDILSTLDEVQRTWERLQRALPSAATLAAQGGIAQDSEALLALFESLTERYAHGMQRLAGDRPGVYANSLPVN